jgi:hypothetical protein
MQQGRFRREDMIIHHPGAEPIGYVPTLVTRGVDQFCLAGMVCFWKALKLQASIACRGKRRSYTITPEALMSLYKQHHGDVLKRGIPNQTLFEAYVQYCFAPKHTVGEQLLEVRRDKRERAAYAAAVGDETSGDEEEEEGDEDDQDDDQRYGVAMA